MLAQAEVASRMWFAGARLQPLGAGHIHDTYLLSPQQQQVAAPAAYQRYVLQRINEQVFTDPQLVMQQTQRLLSHWSSQHRYQVADLQVSMNGRVAEQLDSGVWRVWRFIENSRVLDPLSNIQQAYSAGSAFGFFQRHMSTYQGAEFVETIDGFLQLHPYLQAFDELAGQAPLRWRQLIDNHRNLADQFVRRTHIIHGDCKVNNLLFDTSGKNVLAVIDFDTAMVGHWAWDFGDLIRSICHSQGGVQQAYFAACLRGFAAEQQHSEPAACVDAPAYVALMLGVRFLTDHLQGDSYFKVARRGENLTRAEQQFVLFSELLQQRPQLMDIAHQVMAELAE